MLKEHARVVTAAVMVGDLFLVAAAFVAAHGLRAVVLPALGLVDRPIYPLTSYLPLLPLALVLWGALLWRSGGYRSHRTVPLPRELFDIFRVCVTGTVLLVLAIYLLRLDAMLLEGDTVSRLWIVLFGAVAFAGLAAGKLMLRRAAHLARSRGYNFRTVLVVGTSDSAMVVADAILRHRYWGYRLLGFLTETPPEPGRRLLDRPVLGTVEDLDDVVLQNPVDEVVFAPRTRDEEQDRRVLSRLQELGICVRFAVAPAPQVTLAAQTSELDGVGLITYDSVPARHTELMLKRLSDLSVAAAVLLLALPLLGLIALLIKLDSPGPVLFRQRRIGLNGRRFTLLKFRTMVEGADTRKAELRHLNEADGPMFKVRRDPRVTHFGRLLRRFSLDELPQIWNVLKGEMSLVGPRPLVPEELEQFERWQRRRLSMRPGMTCLWQIRGRSQLPFEESVRLDLAYIDNWSPYLDLKILFKTIPAVLHGRGAW